MRQQRQAATPKGIEKRLDDAQFSKVSDPRRAASVTYALPAMLSALVVAIVTGARALRQLEQRMAQLVAKLGRFHGLTRRIADNTFSTLLPRLRLSEVLACLHRMVKAEQGSDERLKPTVENVAELRALLSAHYPQGQLCVPDVGDPHVKLRVHTATLISSEAAVCIHQRPVEGHTNEIGAMPALLDELKAVYGDLHAEARRALDRRSKVQAKASYTDTQNGEVVTYYLWRTDLGAQGWLDWKHARQLMRVQRIAEHPVTGKRSVGNRYYVLSETSDALCARTALTVSRSHWRCENGTHWTADAELMEDRRRQALSRHPRGILLASAFRMMALLVLAVARQLSRLGYSAERPSWSDVMQHFFLRLCDGILETMAFDTV